MDSNSSVNSLIKIVEYQNDSIVSKILIKKQTGNVTLFAFDKEQELSEHTAPFDDIISEQYIIEGIPDYFNKPLKIAIKHNGSLTNETKNN